MKINLLTEGKQIISGIYLCRQASSAFTKNNTEYVNLTLCDNTGSIEGKIWDPSIIREELKAGSVLRVSGSVTEFNNALQIKITKIEVLKIDEVNLEELLPSTQYNIDKMWNTLVGLINSVKNEHYSMLLKMIFFDSSIENKFKRCAAAVTVHHAFYGGLLQHTLFVTRLAQAYSKIYDNVDYDLLITAALLHDIGKLEELSDFPENQYTEVGSLLGHVTAGVLKISQMIAEITDFSTEERLNLLHCLSAHHGELEYGSPKKPVLLEALLVSLADLTDSRYEIFIENVNSKDPYSKYLGVHTMLTHREDQE